MSLRIVPAASLFTGRKDVMSLRDSSLTQTGHSIMGTGFGSHVHRFSTRFVLTFCHTIINILQRRKCILSFFNIRKAVN